MWDTKPKLFGYVMFKNTQKFQFSKRPMTRGPIKNQVILR